jgi:uncharacterized protein (TIGR03086 family)
MSGYGEQDAGMTEQRDPRPLLAAAFTQTAAVIKAVGPDDGPRPTPCTDFDVDALLRHLIGVAERVGDVPAGIPLKEGHAIVDALPDDPAAAFVELADRALGIWADDSLLGQEMTVPWGRLPGFAVAGAYAMEVTTHGWDLAEAIGYGSPLDEQLGEAVLGVARMALPAEGREGFPFDAAVAVADDAPVYERLAAWLGRRPVRPDAVTAALPS